jgi:anthranilate phosphoribosyltransferase
MNAAAALIAADAADSWERGARLAEASLDEGKAAEALERLRRATA